MSDVLICSYCGKPISENEGVAYPFVGSDKPVHADCAEAAALEEVATTYNEQGLDGLEHFDRQADIQSGLDK